MPSMSTQSFSAARKRFEHDQVFRATSGEDNFTLKRKARGPLRATLFERYCAKGNVDRHT
jgi:hypothetical protein